MGKSQSLIVPLLARSLWMFYYLRRQQVALKNNNDPNEKYLFHGIYTYTPILQEHLSNLYHTHTQCTTVSVITGSRNNAYETILKDGFDHRVVS